MTVPTAATNRSAHHRTNQAILDLAQRDGYLAIAERSPHRTRLRNARAARCKRVQIPYVVIETRRRFCQVEVDTVFLRPRPGSRDSSWHFGDATIERITAILSEFNATGTRWAAGGVFRYGYDVPIDHAPFVAGRLVELARADLKGGAR
jgi:hypothetical protein